ncbi:MAG: lactonase family protein [Sphingobacteriaceae bacterium]
MPVKSFCLLISFVLLQTFAMAQNKNNKGYHLIIGSYTSGKSEGIYTYHFDPVNGSTRYESVVKNVSNPSYLAVSADHQYIYAVNEAGSGKSGVSAFTFNATSGELDFINRQSAEGDSPCYVSVDKEGKTLFVANYSSGNLAAFPLNSNGSLGAAVQVIQHEGKGPDAQRQEKAHVHAVVLSPDEKYLFVDDLGTDKISIYPYKQDDVLNPLQTNTAQTVSVTAGSGPRHLTFHPNHRFAYLIQELSAAISTFEYEDGKLKFLNELPMEDAEFKGQNGAADIHISPDGKFLYGSNRGDANNIAIYKIDQKTGMLTFVARQSSLGKSPRNFAIDPTGKYLLVANQDSDNVVIFKRDQKTGLLKDTGKRIETGNPVCLKFVAVQ